MQREKSLRIQAEADKHEAVEIAEELFEIIEKLQKNLVELSLNTQALEAFQLVLQDITEHQKTLKKESLLEGRHHRLEERRDSSEIKKYSSTTESSMGRVRSQRLLLQPQEQTAAEGSGVLKEGHISKKLSFLHCFI
uniref:Uncharacterized protein n=1 Tax=Knipowitschia caucasica TaxID=637954 RepID=A0AAV2L9W3_KNICA